jgi:alkylation response protein AidB-like acyl-CoA dehydrogenase
VDFDLTEEQSMLRDSVAGYLGGNYKFADRAAAIHSTQGWRPIVWQALANELGVLGVSFPEHLGGFGGGAIENMVLMEELGKVLSLEPFVPTVIIGGGILQRSNHPAASDLIGGVIAGKTIFAFASNEKNGRYNLASVNTVATADGAGWRLNGTKIAVVAAPLATHLIVTARTGGDQRERKGVSVFMVESSRPGITMVPFTRADGLRAADVKFDGVSLGKDDLIGQLDDGLCIVDPVIDEAIAVTCGEACGVMRVMLDSTIEYTKQRKQFGVPLSSFQVLQHRMADMFIHLEQAVSMTYMANIKVSDPAPRAISAAKVRVGRACRFVGENAVQLHGGMGMSEELAVSHYFKRALMIENEFGSIDHHLARFERLS